MHIINEDSDGYISLGHCLIKADAKLKDVLYIEASNELEDSDGDTLMQKALHDERENYLSKGVVSWDHQHKIQKDPNFIIGEPLDVRFGTGKTLVKAKMYLKNKFAQGVMAMAKSGSSRLGASVGGFIMKRIQKIDSLSKSVKKYITKVLWDETAVTYKPINEATLGSVSVMPFEVFAKSFLDKEADPKLYKALMAGYGTDHANFSGGRALIKESLRGSKGKGGVVSLRDRISKTLEAVKKGKVDNFKSFDSLLIKNNLVAHRNQLMRLVINNKFNF